MVRERSGAVAGTRGGAGRIVAMAAALALGLLLLVAGAARSQPLPPTPNGLSVVGGNDWRAENDFDLFWFNSVESPPVAATWLLSHRGVAATAGGAVGFEIDHLDDIRVPLAGEWTITVWLSDTSWIGWPTSGASTTLRLDDVPPRVAFVPGDNDARPEELVALVADAHSGVADGTIYYREPGETRWTELETTLRSGVFGLELAAAPPPAPPTRPNVTYEFQAEARDRAGNVGTTSRRADGTPMALAASPPGGGGRVGRRTWLRVDLRGAGQRRGGATTATVAAGRSALLRGALGDERGGLAGQVVRVIVRPDRGSRIGRRVETVRTERRGRFRLALPPGPSRRLTVVFAGGGALLPARRRLRLRVRAGVSLKASPSRLRTGRRLWLEGRVGGRDARVPRAGKLVTISYWEREARRWRPVLVTRSDRRGRFRAGYRFRYVSGRARIRLRAEAPAEAQWPYAPGASRPLTVEVRG